jgi:hypothetical protein
VSAEEAEKERAKEAAEEAAEAAAEADMAERRRRLREGSERGKALAAEAAAKREQKAAAEAAAQAEAAKSRAAAPSGQAAAEAAAAAAAEEEKRKAAAAHAAEVVTIANKVVAENRDPTPAEIAAAKVPFGAEKYIRVGDDKTNAPTGHRYLLVDQKNNTRYTDDRTVPLYYTPHAKPPKPRENTYDLFRPEDTNLPTRQRYAYNAIPDTWVPKRSGGRVLTFRRKPKSRSKNGRRPTRKSPVRRTR